MPVVRDREWALAYVLRLWLVMDGQEGIWRASLQDVRTGERRGFADLEGACRYLHARIELASAGSPREDPPHGETERG
jgi:hypothetical protein